MEKNFMPIPKNFLTKLIEKGDKLVLYSSFGAMQIEQLRKKFNINEKSLMNFRSNIDLVNKTIMGEKLGHAFRTYPDPDMYGMSCDHYDIQLNFIKLPSDLLDDNLLKFIPLSSDEPEILHFNICKLHFNESGEYNIC